MKLRLSTLLLLITVQWGQSQVAIIPKPNYLGYLTQEASFNFSPQTRWQILTKNDSLNSMMKLFLEQFQAVSGYTLLKGKSTKSILKIEIDKSLKPDYSLKVKSNEIKITAPNALGVFYGLQSLRQLLPVVKNHATITIPALYIEDKARFAWRGMHLDVVRHFATVSQVKQYLDLMAYYKMNTFHWHLTDDQGWRIEIKKYPLLTGTGAWRVDRRGWHFNDRPAANPGEAPTYGGYYTQEDIKEIVQYAAQRQIKVVPEIELPGHSAAAISSYPWLGCTSASQLPMVGGNYIGNQSNYCAGKDSVFTFLKDVMNEVLALFPSEYIHIGGDEVEKKPWKECPKCQARKNELNLKSEEELQSWFVTQMSVFLKSKGRKMVGWDEILEGGLAPDAVVMSWRGESGGIEAAKMKHQVVMTPGSPCYFDHYQDNPETEPKAIGGFNTLKKVFDYEPIPAELGDSLGHFVLGAQGNVWTEYMTTFNHVLYMILPRMPALAEVLWSDPKQKSYQEFYERINVHMHNWELQGLAFNAGNQMVSIKPSLTDGKLLIKMESEHPMAEIRYSLNGEKPGPQSALYSKPFALDSSAVIKAMLFDKKHALGVLPAEQEVLLHKAIGAKVTYTTPTSKSYPAEGAQTLVNGILGPLATRQSWHAILGKDLQATLELPKADSISSLSINCLHFYRAWVFLPSQVSFEVSEDGSNWQNFGVASYPYTLGTEGVFTYRFEAKANLKKGKKPLMIKYIRVSASNPGKCPPGHPGEGQATWLFADEIIVR